MRIADLLHLRGMAPAAVGETTGNGIGPTVWGSDGENCEVIPPGSATPSSRNVPRFLRIGTNAVFRWAAYEMSGVGQRAIAAAGLQAHDIDVFITRSGSTR